MAAYLLRTLGGWRCSRCGRAAWKGPLNLETLTDQTRGQWLHHVDLSVCKFAHAMIEFTWWGLHWIIQCTFQSPQSSAHIQYKVHIEELEQFDLACDPIISRAIIIRFVASGRQRGESRLFRRPSWPREFTCKSPVSIRNLKHSGMIRLRVRLVFTPRRIELTSVYNKWVHIMNFITSPISALFNKQN